MIFFHHLQYDCGQQYYLIPQSRLIYSGAWGKDDKMDCGCDLDSLYQNRVYFSNVNVFSSPHRTTLCFTKRCHRDYKADLSVLKKLRKRYRNPMHMFIHPHRAVILNNSTESTVAQQKGLTLKVSLASYHPWLNYTFCFALQETPMTWLYNSFFMAPGLTKPSFTLTLS